MRSYLVEGIRRVAKRNSRVGKDLLATMLPAETAFDEDAVSYQRHHDGPALFAGLIEQDRRRALIADAVRGRLICPVSYYLPRSINVDAPIYCAPNLVSRFGTVSRMKIVYGAQGVHATSRKMGTK